MPHTIFDDDDGKRTRGNHRHLRIPRRVSVSGEMSFANPAKDSPVVPAAAPDRDRWEGVAP